MGETRAIAPRLLAAAALLLSGCSLMLNWDETGLACTAAQECVGVDTCLDGKCIAPKSRSLGQTCLADAQCNGGNLCPTGVCAAPCALQTAYTVGSCAAGEYCGAFLSYAGDTNITDPPVPRWVAACVTNDACTPGTTCTQVEHGMCTTLNSAQHIQACLPNCAVQITSGTVSTNCADAYYPRYCTPVGEAGDQQLACVNVGAAPLPLGQPCNTAAAPCAALDACINGTCRSYCQLGATTAATSGCASTQQCCPLQANATLLLGYCADTCP